jgi:hypothetical protein
MRRKRAMIKCCVCDEPMSYYSFVADSFIANVSTVDDEVVTSYAHKRCTMKVEEEEDE